MCYLKKKSFYLLVLIILGFFLLSYKNRLYNWDKAVQEYINNFSCKLTLIETYEDLSSDRIVYKYQTNDDLKIIFHVECFFGNILSPFDFEIPIKEAKIIDDFEMQICNYVSETYGTYNIEEKSIEDISSYVIDIVKKCQTLFREYGIEHRSLNITFTFIEFNKLYTFKYGNTNEVLLFNNLVELLYE